MKSKRQIELLVCDNCGVKAARIVKRPQILGRGAKMILVDNVPVIACRNCGENYMTSETMHRLDKIRMNQKAEMKERKIAAAEFIYE
jgi:YgiT-type zinc finger domain-containing protein